MNVQIYYVAAAAMDKEDPGKFGCFVQVLSVRPFSRPVGESGPPSVNRRGGGGCMGEKQEWKDDS